ncbi:MAG: FAD-dependent oxidoreductase [Pyrobaculum sp.]|uniref:FAD-dependent oxidoreductase n=1 Tax=Pyrobaculum sp. TaxID=2004705 RepID=UPI003CA6BEB0
MIVVIGGGVVGLFAAYYLKREGVDVTLVEARDIAHSSRAAVLEFTKFELNKAALRRIDSLWLLTYLKMYGRDPGADV